MKRGPGELNKALLKPTSFPSPLDRRFFSAYDGLKMGVRTPKTKGGGPPLGKAIVTFSALGRPQPPIKGLYPIRNFFVIPS